MENTQRIQLKIEDWNIEAQTGYKPITTFYAAFSIAERFGTNAIEDTYKRACNEWKGNYKYITELVLVLNWKGWRWFNCNESLSRLYFDRYHELAAWCEENLQGDELDYYFQTID